MLKDHHDAGHAHEHEQIQAPAAVASEIPHHIPFGAIVFSESSIELTISPGEFVIDIGYPWPMRIE